MKIRISSLELQFKQGSDSIAFTDFTFFYGKMGAGKSSIARLIDFCLGGDLDLSPALQSEFVSAKLNLFVADVPLSLERVRDSGQIVAGWKADNGPFDVILPARSAAGEVIPGSGVENLSDLLFYLTGIQPPKVRRSKSRDDSELERLSIRNLLWYCYLDQDGMDSSFFNLEGDAAFYKRNKSKDVLRYIVGFHQEQVAELEMELQVVHEKRLGSEAGAKSLSAALESGGIANVQELEARLLDLNQELGQVNAQISQSREHTQVIVPHHADELRRKAKSVQSEIVSIEDALTAIENAIDGDQRHLHELQTLKVKFKRASSARSILAGVDFFTCPSCSQALPMREVGTCKVCGQPEPEEPLNNLNLEVIDTDASARIQELTESTERHSKQLSNMRHRQQELVEEKRRLDQAITDAMREYDSAYLSATLGTERRKAEIEQTISRLRDYVRLAGKVDDLLAEATNLEVREHDIRQALKQARNEAEQDTANLSRLEIYFLDCLLRAKLPGIKPGDLVSIKAPHFLPEVMAPEIGDLAVTSFSNISSGGKKSLFKSCFAVAIHRLAVNVGAVLPTFLILDSPMKNISERENQEQFEGFHRMLYELASTELSGTQFILIDKEFCAPPDEGNINLTVRHMTPEDSDNPPLVRYYRGH